MGTKDLMIQYRRYPYERNMHMPGNAYLSRRRIHLPELLSYLDRDWQIDYERDGERGEYPITASCYDLEQNNVRFIQLISPQEKNAPLEYEMVSWQGEIILRDLRSHRPFLHALAFVSKYTLNDPDFPLLLDGIDGKEADSLYALVEHFGKILEITGTDADVAAKLTETVLQISTHPNIALSATLFG